ncbi:ABC-2 family transporter protein [Candidatus Daviesbacteria bacterium]|nr:ABC-2 family transporter protein [Candidatus Daviesbacteria bacterium]
MRAIWALFKIHWLEIFEYRVDSLIYTLGNILFPLVMLVVWLKISQTSGNELAYSANQLTIYYLTLGFVQLVTSVWGAWFMNEDIRNGRLSKYLTKPISYFWYSATQNISEKAFRLFILLPFLLAAYFTFKVDFNFNTWSLMLFFMSLVLALILRLLVDFSLGLLAFWLSDNRAALSCYLLLDTILSGRVIPLVFFPAAFGSILYFSPFRFWVSFPIEIMVGKATPSEIWQGFILQIGWILIAFVVMRLVWFFGIREYQAVGA